MEIDRAITEETAQASSKTQTSPPKTTAARSYECMFCKRGFSNAQALGGHMNIHTKDRAKLKKQSPFPLNVSAKVIPPFMGYAPQLMPNPSSCPCLSRGRGRGDDHWESSSLGPAAAVEELDLELRLGPERPDHASSMGQRQFL